MAWDIATLKDHYDSDTCRAIGREIFKAAQHIKGLSCEQGVIERLDHARHLAYMANSEGSTATWLQQMIEKLEEFYDLLREADHAFDDANAYRDAVQTLERLGVR